MKISKIMAPVLLIVFGFSNMHGVKYNALPAELDGSMSLYDFDKVEASILPDSLKPVHISYIARHGARYLTSEDKVLKVEKALKKAESAGTLTRQGRECLALMQSVREQTAGQWGMLSPIGVAQERRLGAEMATMYPALFATKDAKVAGVSSYVPRVVETMDNFVVPILRAHPGILTTTSSGKEYDYLTRFFVTDKAYDDWRHNGNWREVYDRFVADSLPVAPAQRLVGDNSGFTTKELKSLTYNLYKVLQGLRAMSMSAPTTQWMSEQEYRQCWEATNLEKYYQYSLSSLSTQPAQGATDVLLALLNQISRLENGAELPVLYGIFGHAETLLPVFSLLGIEGTVSLPLDPMNLSQEWSDAVLTPLAANLEIVYTQGDSAAYYASMRLNGRNIAPVSDGRKIVPIAELRDYWLHRLSSLF